jgi:hypothetical protein
MGYPKKTDKLGNVILKQDAELVDVAPAKSFETAKEPGDGWGLMGMFLHVMIYTPPH